MTQTKSHLKRASNKSKRRKEDYCAWAQEGEEFSDITKRVVLARVKACFNKDKCEFPGCNEDHPEDLEYHHIRPRRFGGEDDVRNAVRFCGTHHGWADRALVTPWEINDRWERYDPDSLTRQITSTAEIEEAISLVPTGDPGDEAFARAGERGVRSEDWRQEYWDHHMNLERLRRCRPSGNLQKERERAKARCMLWMAGNLTAGISTQSRCGIPDRFEIWMLADSARKLARKQAKDWEVVVRAGHSLATFWNSMRDLTGEASGKARALNKAVMEVREAVRIAEERKCCSQGYMAFLYANGASIQSRAGDIRCAKIYLGKGDRLCSPGSDLPMRHAQVHLFAGELSSAEEWLDYYSRGGLVVTPIQRVIWLRLQATYHAVRGAISEAEDMFNLALSEATRGNWGHQCGAIQQSERFVKSKEFLDFLRSGGATSLERSVATDIGTKIRYTL